ncbi:MAG: uncharacterized protein JWM88_1069, partial [Verrucomicrobia bacterium]|nr:uncharacterized protein [Verrucomicrobiota bacterium]
MFRAGACISAEYLPPVRRNRSPPEQSFIQPATILRLAGFTLAPFAPSSAQPQLTLMKRFLPRKRRRAVLKSVLHPRKPRPLSVSLGRFGSAFAMLGALAAGVSGARAAVLNFDASNAFGIQEGVGAWNTTTPLWTTDAGATNLTFTQGDSAVFGGGISGSAGLVTLGQPITVGSIVFNTPFGGAYNIAGGGFGLTVNDGLFIHTVPSVISNNVAVSAATVSAAVTLGNAQTWLNDSAGLFTMTGSINNGGGLLTLSNTSTGAQTLTGVISGLGGLTVNNTGSGVTTLSAATPNLFTGPTLISSGILTATTSGGLVNSLSVTLGVAGVIPTLAPTLNANGVIFNTAADVNLAVPTAVLNLGAVESISTLTGVGTVNVNNALTLTSNSDFSYGNVTQGAIGGGAAFNKNGTGVLTLGGTSGFTGLFNLNAGTLKLASAGALGSASNVIVANNVTLDLGGFATARPLNLIGVGSGAGALISSGSGVATASGAITLAGATTIGGTGQISFTGVFDALGAAPLTKTGTGIAIFGSATAATRTGTTTVNAGTLRLVAASGTTNPLSTGSIILNGGVLSLAPTTASGNLAVDAQFSAAGSSTILTDSTLIQGLRNLTFGTGATGLTLMAGPLLAINTAGAALFTGTVTLSGPTTFTVVNNGTALETLTLGALADGSTARTIIKEGGGNVTFNTAASSLGAGTALTINRGSVTSSLASALGTAAAVTVNNNALFTVGVAQQVGSLSGAGSVTLTGLLTVGDTSNTTFSGVLAGTAGLTKVGTGVLTLSGPNTTANPIVINTGTLRAQDLTGALGTGGITMTAVGTATLDLRANTTQSFGNAVTLTTNATINVDNTGSSTAPTNNVLSLGALTMGAQTLSVTAGHGYWVNIAGAPTFTGT